ncbi:MAG: hypothetical protein C4583_15645 [Anaerolineaceae bacterium]|nr:MAG: hypothetical protein C4583_15645 [Anaerolineaceae bacterium]
MVTPAHESVDGNERHERKCVHCGLTRITLIPPRGECWHEWKTVAGEKWQGELTPPCIAVIVAEAVT